MSHIPKPGDWHLNFAKFNRKPYHWHIADKKRGSMNAVAMSDEEQGEPRTPEELAAIAHLIFAAPDLLAALKAIIEACDKCGKDDERSLVDEFTQEIEDAARAAIAKAEGRHG